MINLKRLRYIIRDICLMISYMAGAAATLGIARSIWLIIEKVTESK